MELLSRSYSLSHMVRILLSLLISLATFSIGLSLDKYLRTRNSGITDCFCMTLKCRAITLAEHPLIVVRHPLEAVTYLTTYTVWE